MSAAYTAQDIEEQLANFCQDRDIDPESFLEIQNDFRRSWLDAFDEFLVLQKERAVRFRNLYAELDDLDMPKVYEKLKKTRTRKRMVQIILDATAKIRALIKKGDVPWIQHREYNNEFFQYSIPHWQREKPSRDHVLGCIQYWYDIDDPDEQHKKAKCEDNSSGEEEEVDI